MAHRIIQWRSLRNWIIFLVDGRNPFESSMLNWLDPILVHGVMPTTERTCIVWPCIDIDMIQASQNNKLFTIYLFRLRKIDDAISYCRFTTVYSFPVKNLIEFCWIRRNRGFEIERAKEVAEMLVGVHDFRTFMSVSREQKTVKLQSNRTIWICDRLICIFFCSSIRYSHDANLKA